MAWVLTVGMTTVRGEFDSVWPSRDKASDGSKGDPAHAASVSGHNPDKTGNAEYKDGDSLDEVRAIDVDDDLVPGSGTDWMELVVQHIVKRARAGTYVPFRYIIYKGRIWSRTSGWVTQTYTGSNDHSKHAHFSGDYTQTADNWTGSLGLAAVAGGSGGLMFCKYGNQGDAVKFLQYQLHNLGYTEVNPVDGDYGDKTAKALAHAIKDYNGSVIDGKTYGPSQMIYISVMWVRKFSAGKVGPAGPAGPKGDTGPAGPKGDTGAAGPPGELTGTFNVEGGTIQVSSVPETGRTE
jgi:hypothetical protein